MVPFEQSQAIQEGGALAEECWLLRQFCLQCGRPGFDPCVGQIPWRRKWQPTPVLLPGNFHGWRSLVGYSPWGRKELHTTEQLHFLTFPFFLMVFPVVTYGCESWTTKKAEHQRIDAFQLWCWRRLVKVPWKARRSNQSILKEINPEYTLAPDVKTQLIGKDPDAGKD